MLDRGLEKKRVVALFALGTSDVMMPSDISRHSKFMKVYFLPCYLELKKY